METHGKCSKLGSQVIFYLSPLQCSLQSVSSYPCVHVGSAVASLTDPSNLTHVVFVSKCRQEHQTNFGQFMVVQHVHEVVGLWADFVKQSLLRDAPTRQPLVASGVKPTQPDCFSDNRHVHHNLRVQTPCAERYIQAPTTHSTNPSVFSFLPACQRRRAS